MRLAELLDRARSAPGVAVFCDFDGTVSPIVRDPAAARILSPARRALRAIARSARGLAAVVSGRGLEDLARRAGVPGAWLVGNHGLEWRDPSGRTGRLYGARELDAAGRFERRLAGELAGLPGARIENKGPGVVLHLRGAAPKAVRTAERAFARAMREAGGGFDRGLGRRILEARLPAANKASAVRLVARGLRSGTLFVALGDDRTDRDLLDALPAGGVRVVVGKMPYARADLRLESPREAAAVLMRLAQATSAGTGRGSRARPRRTRRP